MSKLQKIKQAISTASDNDATKAIKYLLWYIESQQSEIEFLKRASKIMVTSPEHNAANQIEYSRRMVDSGEIQAQEHDVQVSNFKKNV